MHRTISRMKSLALMSLAVLLGVAACMSVQEYEDDEANTRDLGWFHIHFHFLEGDAEPKPKCSGNTCKLCNRHVLKADVDGHHVVLPFNGCLNVEKNPSGFKFSFVQGGKTEYTNTYEMNALEVLPCGSRSMKGSDGADICPVLFKVDEKKGNFCAKVVEKLKLGDSYLEHTVQLGCSKF